MLPEGPTALKRDSATGPDGTLLIFPGALGDAVCLEPTVARLARDGPVTFCARLGAAEVAALFPSRPRIASLDAREIAWLFAPRPAAAEDDPGRGFLSSFARVRSFSGADSDVLRDRLAAHPDARLAPFPARESPVHASHRFLRAALGDPSALADAPRLNLDGRPGDARASGRLILHPGSGGRAKCAPADAFIEVARRWRRAGGEARVLLGPAEAGSERAWRECGLDVVAPASVRALAEEIAGARVFLGNDSGPSHVAAALDIPSLVLFVASDPGSFGPRGRSVRWLDLRESPADAGRVAARVWEALEATLP